MAGPTTAYGWVLRQANFFHPAGAPADYCLRRRTTRERGRGGGRRGRGGRNDTQKRRNDNAGGQETRREATERRDKTTRGKTTRQENARASQSVLEAEQCPAGPNGDHGERSVEEVEESTKQNRALPDQIATTGRAVSKMSKTGAAGLHCVSLSEYPRAWKAEPSRRKD